MNWSDIGKKVGGALPLIGSLLGGPAGASIGSLAAHALGVEDSPDAVDAAIEKDPDALLKLRQLQADHEKDMRQLAITSEQNLLAADTASIQAVNATMQAEANSEHCMQWSWRPIDGILFAPTLIGLYIVLPLMHIAPPEVPLTVWEAWGALLGITAWHRGVKQRIQSGDRATLGGGIGQTVGKLLAGKGGTQ